MMEVEKMLEEFHGVNESNDSLLLKNKGNTNDDLVIDYVDLCMELPLYYKPTFGNCNSCYAAGPLMIPCVNCDKGTNVYFTLREDSKVPMIVNASFLAEKMKRPDCFIENNQLLAKHNRYISCLKQVPTQGISTAIFKVLHCMEPTKENVRSKIKEIEALNMIEQEIIEKKADEEMYYEKINTEFQTGFF